MCYCVNSSSDNFQHSVTLVSVHKEEYDDSKEITKILTQSVSAELDQNCQTVFVLMEIPVQLNSIDNEKFIHRPNMQPTGTRSCSGSW